MAQDSLATINISAAGVIAHKWQNLRTINESSSQDEQRNIDHYRLLSAKVERCVQELVERVYKRNSSLSFELLAPPSSHLSSYLSKETNEFYFDFYIVWKNPGQIQIERDLSSICCKIQYLDRLIKWSRAEQDRLLISNVTKKKRYLNGRSMRDLFFETLHDLSPDLIRLDFIEHLIYFDLIIPSLIEKFICHITLLPCIHLPEENQVLLPLGTIRWYPRLLLSLNENSLVLNSLRQPLKNMSVRHYISTSDTIDKTEKITRKDQQRFARVRAIIHELLLPCTLEHVDNIEQIREPFENDNNGTKKSFFLPHKLDRNCNVFPAGQYLLDDVKAKRFFREFLRANIKSENYEQTDNNEVNV